MGLFRFGETSLSSGDARLGGLCGCNLNIFFTTSLGFPRGAFDSWLGGGGGGGTLFGAFVADRALGSKLLFEAGRVGFELSATSCMREGGEIIGEEFEEGLRVLIGLREFLRGGFGAADGFLLLAWTRGEGENDGPIA